MTATYYDTNVGGLSNVEIDANFRTVNWIKGAEQPASATMSLPSQANYFVVTGNTAITGINDVQNGDAGIYGYMVRFKFSGAPQLTHGAGFLLQFGANMQMAAGDVATFVNESAGVYRLVSYLPASTMGDITVGAIDATSYDTGTILSTVEGITQGVADDSTKVATTEYVDRAAGVSNQATLRLAGAVSSIGVATNFPAGWTVFKQGTGKYLISQPLGHVEYSVSAIVSAATGEEAYPFIISADDLEFTIETVQNGIVTDSAFHIQVWDYS